MQITVILALFALVYYSQAANTTALIYFDDLRPEPISTFTCLKSNNASGVLINIWHGTNTSEFAVENINLAKQLGLNVQLWAYIQPGYYIVSPKEFAAQLTEFLAGQQLEKSRVWLTVWGGWSANYTDNELFLDATVEAGKALGLELGVHTSKRDWASTFEGNYTAAASLPLIYLRSDGSKNFDDWTPFGGWTLPSGKVFDSINRECDEPVDLVWFA